MAIGGSCTLAPVLAIITGRVSTWLKIWRALEVEGAKKD